MDKIKLRIREYIEQNRAWFVFALRLFLLAAFLGALTVFIKPDLIEKIVAIFQDKFGPEPARNLGLAKEIFLQNTLATMLALLGGILFGISSFVIIFFNGFLIGFVLLTLLMVPGNPLNNILYIILGLVPHGIFELPAFLIASALGLRLGTEWLTKESAGHRFQVLKNNIKRSLFSIPGLVALLMIAALMEVFVSGAFVDKF